MFLSLAVALLVLESAPAPPAVGAALDLEREGKAREALSVLAAAPVEPGAALAGRILYERARITDEHLRDPLGAAKLYREYRTSFPGGPYAKLAADRESYLLRNGSAAPEALAEYEDVLRDFARRSSEGGTARMAQVVEKYPAFPLRARACFWLANVLRQRRDFAGAARWLEVVMRDYPGTGDAHRAELARAQNDVAQDRFGRALAVFRGYLDSADPLARELAHAGLQGALDERRWYWLFRAGLALIGGWVLALSIALVRRRAPLRPFPFEVRLFAPVALVLALLTFVENRKVGIAVTIIAGGGLLLAALQGAYLRVAAPRGARRLLHVAVSAGAAASLAFCAIDACGLMDLVVTTIEQGADR